jgi:AcrR family transcriptional regulator
MSANARQSNSRRRPVSRDALLAAALDVFLKHGFQAARIEDIAQLAGVGKGSVYLHFANKEELFQAVIDTGVGTRLGQAELLASEFQGSAAELLTTMFHNNLVEFWDSPSSGIHKLIVAESQRFPKLAASYQQAITHRARTLVAGILELGIASGEFRNNVDVDYTARLIVDALDNELIQAHAFSENGSKPFDAHRFIDVLLGLVVSGIGSSAHSTFTGTDT